MIINRLDLMAYGPFGDAVLDFAAGRAAFHLVYGPNEAGKSSALRALRNLFFGIPARTPDSFRHPHPKLRIGAELLRSDGQTLAIIRRKGLRKTLRGPDDRSPVEEEALASFLGGVDRDLFEQMFAIGHQDLVQGGEEIIAGGGRVGQALFAAGAGLVRLQRLQQDLDQTLEALFKPSGSKPHINRTVALLKDARQQQKAALLLANTWKTHHAALEDARAEQALNRQRLAEHKQAYAALERLHEALPLIARREELSEALANLEAIPELAEDFEDRRRATEKTLTIAANDVERTRKTIDDLEARLNTLAVPGALLQQAPLVEALQQDLGSFRKARQDRPALEARMRTLSQQAAHRLAHSGVADAAGAQGAPRLTAAVISDVQEMAQTHERLQTRLESLGQRRRELETEMAALAAEKETLPPDRDVTDLKAILKDVQDAGPLEKQLTEVRHAWDQQIKTLANRLKRQTLWAGSLEALDALPLPQRERIDRIEERLGASERQIERLREDQAQEEAERETLRTDLQILESDHEIPSEETLKAAREKRRQGWHLVRRHLEGRTVNPAEVRDYTGSLVGDGSLAEAFETSMAHADHIADRLRNEAEAVSRKTLLQARRRQTEEKLGAIARAIDTALAEAAELGARWEALWSPAGIAPRSPAEMRRWLSDMTDLREKAALLWIDQAKISALAAQIDRYQTRLQNALATAPGDRGLAELVGLARDQAAAEETRRSQIARLEEALGQRHKEHRKVVAAMEDLERDRQRWQETWAETLAPLAMAAETRPAAALAMIESIREAQAYQEEAAVLDKRIRGIDRDAESFRERVSRLVDQLAPELRGTPPEEAAPLLSSKLTEGRSQQSRQSALQRQLEIARTEAQNAHKRREDAAALMRTLCREARCADPADLPEIEKRARRRNALRQENDDIADRLRRLSGGATVDAFAAEAQAVDPDTLAPEMDRRKEAIAALEEERSALDQTIGTARAELKRMDGRAEAAAHAAEAEHQLARLESQVERYARTKIAATLLARTIEQYREKHQGPLIARASTLFSRMTREAFRGVRAEYDDKGQPVLVGIRNHREEPVGVNGMSDGTADQLYLALRLASLERYLEHGEPLPFVVDDILLRFDDERALATLEILLELSAKTQVIFFTHHHHLVALARQAFGDRRINVMPLTGESPAVDRN